jgi:hydrogenase expression/formation protein HypD
MHKLTPPAMRAILSAGETRVDAILGPGHVTAITGWRAWEFLPQEYGLPCAVAGFEPLDILQAILALVRAVVAGTPQVINAYGRGVSAEGNRVAQDLLAQVYEVSEAAWRGLGTLPQSGLAIRAAFAAHDARRLFDLPPAASTPARVGCRCGEVLRGVLEPPQCALFGRACTPLRPRGPCMVSAEGACAAHYQYGGTVE